MMKKTMIVLCLIVPLLALAGCWWRQSETTVTTAAAEETITVQTSAAAVEDSIFDDEEETTTAPAEVSVKTTAAANEPKRTEAPRPSTAPKGDGQEDEIVEPEAPKQTVAPATAKPTATPKPTKTPKPSPTPRPEVNIEAEDPAEQYEEFEKLTPNLQQAYMESFDSVEKFFEWYNKAKEAYEKDHPAIEVGGNGTIDFNDIIKDDK